MKTICALLLLTAACSRNPRTDDGREGTGQTGALSTEGRSDTMPSPTNVATNGPNGGQDRAPGDMPSTGAMPGNAMDDTGAVPMADAGVGGGNTTRDAGAGGGTTRDAGTGGGAGGRGGTGQGSGGQGSGGQGSGGQGSGGTGGTGSGTGGQGGQGSGQGGGTPRR